MSADLLGFNPDFGYGVPLADLNLGEFGTGAGLIGAGAFGDMLGGPAGAAAFGIGALGYSMANEGLPVAGSLGGLYGLGGTGFGLGF